MRATQRQSSDQNHPKLISQVSLGFVSSNSGKSPKNGRLSRPALCCDFSVQNVAPGRVWVEKLCHESFHDLQKLWQAIKSIEAAPQMHATANWLPWSACEIPIFFIHNFTQLAITFHLKNTNICKIPRHDIVSLMRVKLNC